LINSKKKTSGDADPIPQPVFRKGHADFDRPQRPERLTIKIGPALISSGSGAERDQKGAAASVEWAQIRVRCRTGGLSHVLHRLMTSGSDRYCERWRRDYAVAGTERLSCTSLPCDGFLGAPLADQSAASALTPRCNKDLIEEDLFKTGAICQRAGAGLLRYHFDLLRGEGGEALGERASARITGQTSSRWWSCGD